MTGRCSQSLSELKRPHVPRRSRRWCAPLSHHLKVWLSMVIEHPSRGSICLDVVQKVLPHRDSGRHPILHVPQMLRMGKSAILPHMAAPSQEVHTHRVPIRTGTHSSGLGQGITILNFRRCQVPMSKLTESTSSALPARIRKTGPLRVVSARSHWTL